MKLIGEIAEEHDLWIISDEVYREFVYDGREATLTECLMISRTELLSVDSVSKRFSACGARVGAVISKNRGVNGWNSEAGSGKTLLSDGEQIGAAALYRMDKSYEDAKAEYCAEEMPLTGKSPKFPVLYVRSRAEHSI